MLALTANRSPIVDLVDASDIAIDIDYDLPDGTARTVAVFVIPLHIEQRSDGSIVVPLIAKPGTEAIPHGVGVLRVEPQ